MAFDKLVDSAQLDAGLTSVADAIRAKGGTTDAMAFPDGFVSAVEGIQAGGGEGKLWGRPYLSGSFTLAEDTTTEYTIADISSLKTNNKTYWAIAYIWCDETQLSDPQYLYSSTYTPVKYGNNETMNKTASYGTTTSANQRGSGGLDVSSGMLTCIFTSKMIGRAGNTYHWIALQHVGG